jgi:GTPase SAR1 family protein
LASFRRCEQWLAEIRRLAVPGASVILLGNKADLGESRRAVPRAEAQQFAEKHGLLFFEVSACSDTSSGQFDAAQQGSRVQVDDVFATLSAELLKASVSEQCGAILSAEPSSTVRITNASTKTNRKKKTAACSC